MRVTGVEIEHYRSVGHVRLQFPPNRPLILFGPNNAGKSNIISAIDRTLGERWPFSREMEDSDFFLRNRESYPESKVRVDFDEVFHVEKYSGRPHSSIVALYKSDSSESHFESVDGGRLYLNNDSRSSLQSYLVDAERDIERELSYYSRYSLLSKFSHAIHSSLGTADKESLEAAYSEIKATFEGVPNYRAFFSNFHEAMENSLKGFVHDLKVDFSAYDPNNFARSMRIIAFEGNQARSFNEFGTGEQQILLMTFAKAYVQTFGAGSLMLIIEEPEAHLHPLAQKWLKEYIYGICGEGLQIILSTHSADFLDMSNLDGLVRVYKDSDGITSAIQVTKDQLVDFCHETGVPSNKIHIDNVLNFYETKLFPDEAKGFFATKVLIVEGATEYYSIPLIMEKLGHSLTQEGIEIVNARGKNSIPLYWRLFSAFGIQCCCIFDADGNKPESKKANQEMSNLLGIDVGNSLVNKDNQFFIQDGFAYYRDDFEHFMRNATEDYARLEQHMTERLGITSKPGKAKACTQFLPQEQIPSEYEELWQRVIFPKRDNAVYSSCPESVTLSSDLSYDDDIPF